jgi:CopG family transcriptional regulator/antitoxin EndoAI
MRGGKSIMQRRINISLPEETIRVIDRVAEKGQRSSFIDAAVRHYVTRRGKGTLKKLLREGAEERASRDLLIAEEWAALEDET